MDIGSDLGFGWETRIRHSCCREEPSLVALRRRRMGEASAAEDSGLENSTEETANSMT